MYARAHTPCQKHTEKGKRLVFRSGSEGKLVGCEVQAVNMGLLVQCRNSVHTWYQQERESYLSQHPSSQLN